MTEQWIECPKNEARNHFLAKSDLKRAQIMFLMPKSNPAWSICSQLGGHLKDLSKIEAPYGKIEILEWKSEHRQIAARARARARARAIAQRVRTPLKCVRMA